MRLIDADKYKEEIMLIMRCWNISPALSPSEARKSVRNLEVALRTLSEISTFLRYGQDYKETRNIQISTVRKRNVKRKWKVVC